MSIEVAPEDQERTTDKLAGVLLANRYLIEHKLGEGAMGAVYRARHVKVGRPFAVKVLHRKLLEEKKIAQRFDREAELAGRLHHPNVIGVVDVGETPDGLRYMVMDFAEGEDLAELLEEAPMPPERIIHLARQMLEGLYHAHEAGLIHRDFKPENVIVERNDHGIEVPRIVDFGISILREGGDSNDAAGRLTTNGLVLGTPHYMAPEQAVADPIDHRIDLFAMGIVVYEMLSGKLPFEGNGVEVARANLLLDPPPISQRVPYLEVDPLLEAFARRLMAKKRDHRPATAKRARELLDLIERDRPAAAAALGVPLEEGTREPKATQPVGKQAVAPQALGHHETATAKHIPTPGEPPPVAPAGPRPSNLEAPPIQQAAAVAVATAAAPLAAAPPSSREVAASTTMAEPLPWGDARPRSKRRWLIAGGAGLAASGAILAITLGASGGDGAKPPEPAKVAMPASPEPAPAPPAPAPSPEAAGSAAATAVSDPPPGPGSAAEVQPAVDPDPAKPEPAPPVAAPTLTRPVKVRKPDPTPTRPTKPEVKPEVTRPDPDRSGPRDRNIVEIPPRVGDPAASGAALHHEWEVVRDASQAIKRSLGVACTACDRWLRIQILDMMGTPEKRRVAAAQLAEIRKLLAAVQQKP